VTDDLRLDPSAPVFFVSYPRVPTVRKSSDPADQAPVITRFFDDLTANVNELLPLSTGHQPGFLDTTMRGGELWEQELLAAIGRCQVFVPLLSPRFLHSRWCRFEWEAFGRRTVRTRNPGGPSRVATAQAAIVPVTWTAVEPARLPPTVTKVQAFTFQTDEPRIVEVYQQEGVLGLLKMGMDRQYNVVVWRLAQRVAEIVYHYKVDSLVPRDTAGLGESFMEDDDR
jgi:hypothetical protein